MDRPARAIFVALVLANASLAAEVSATRVDGVTFSGELKRWDDKFAVLEMAEGEQRIAVEQLLSLRWHSGTQDAEPAAASQLGQVELIDGSVLSIREFRTSGAKAIVTLAGATTTDADTLTIAKRQIAAVRLQPLDAALVEQWNDIRAMQPAADVIVLLKREAQSLDYVEGVLGDVSAEKIAFEFDGDTRQIDREKVAGLIYFRRGAATAADARFVLHGRSGLKAEVARAEFDGDSLQLTTASRVKLDWPLDDIYFADFSAGKLLYLSDLEPASQSATPLVALPGIASLAGRYAEPRRDQSAFGGPLTLPTADDPSHPNMTVQSYAKGLSIRSRTELVYRLPTGYRRLNVIAGIDPATRDSGNVHVEILGDDRPLLSTNIEGADPPRSIDLDIAGVKRLKFVVDYGRNMDTGDWLNLCDLRVVK